MARSYFILKVLLSLMPVCWGLFMNTKPAELTPVDVLVFIGETLQVNCKLTSAARNISASDMYITTYTSEELVVKMENTTIVDDKTILARFEITNDFVYYSKINCKAKNTTLRTIGLYVERPIQNVTNFSGVYFSESQQIVMTWSLGETYLRKVLVETDWNPNSPPNESGNRCNTSTNQSCVISYSGSDVLIIRINVSLSNNYKRPSEEFLVPLYDISATSLHAFIPLDNLKTGPPQSVRVVNKSSTCANISWENPGYFIQAMDDPIFRFELQMDSDTEYKVVKNNITIPKSSRFFQLCELIPYTKYSLSVRIKARAQNPWSDPADVELITDEDIPLTGPPLKDTSYYTEDCQQNVRKLLLYWNDPSKASLQGQLTMYEVESNNQSELLRFSNNYYATNLDCESTYEILVFSATKVGRSSIPSKIIIPKESAEIAVKDDLLFRVEDISETSGERSMWNITAMWDAKGLAANTTLTLYMCQETYLPKTCLNDFKAIEVKVSQRNLTLYNIPVTTNLFGYSLRDEAGHKRGIKWTNCVYRADTRPTQPTSLRVNTGSLSNSLLIIWTPTQCSKNTKLLILKYHIYICKTKVDRKALEGGACFNVVISDMSVDTYTATDLQPRSYYVFLQEESPAGLGPPSEPVLGIAKISDTDFNIGIVLGIIAALLVVGSVLFCLMRLCFKSKRRVEFLTKHESRITSNGTAKTTCNQDTDSGICTNSSPNSSSDRTSEELDPSSLIKCTSQPPSPSLSDRHSLADVETSSIAEHQHFLHHQAVENSRSATPKGEYSNPSADIRSQQFSDYITQGLGNPYVSSEEVSTPSRKPSVDKHHSMDTSGSSLEQNTYIKQVYDTNINDSHVRINDESERSADLKTTADPCVFGNDASDIPGESQILVVTENPAINLQSGHVTPAAAAENVHIGVDVDDPSENVLCRYESQGDNIGYVALNSLQPNGEGACSSESSVSLDDVSGSSCDYKTVNYIC